MSSGINLNNNIALLSSSKNIKAKSLSNAQNLSFCAQNQPVSDVYQAGNNVQTAPAKTGKGKLLFNIALIAAGAGVTALILKIKGKSASKTAEKAASAIADSASKAESAAAQGADKNTESVSHPFIQSIKDKIKSFSEDFKTTYDETAPASSSKSKKRTKTKAKKKTGVKKTVKQPKPATLHDKITGMLTSIDEMASSFEKTLDNANASLASAGDSMNSAAKAMNSSAKETESWVQKVINDFSSVSGSSVKRKGIGKSNIFSRDNADEWYYFEGYTKAVGKRAKIKRRITAKNDEMTVCINNVKNNKKGIETADEVFKINTTSGETKHYTNYKLTSDGVEYSKCLTSSSAAGVPETYTAGCIESADGTVKIAEQFENSGSYGMYYRDLTKYADSRETCYKMLSYNSSAPEFYMEGYQKHADGSFECIKEFDFTKGLYYEGSKVNADGSEIAGKKMQLDNNKKPQYCMIGYKKAASGEIGAGTRVEYAFGTNEPRYYFENYKYDPSTGNETYSLKAELKNGKWVKV